MLAVAPLAPASPAPASLLEEGIRAQSEGLPPVAAYKLRAFLRSNPPPPLPARREAVFALTRALLDVPDAPAALALLDDEHPLPPTTADHADPALAFWRAQALAALERWPEALAQYSRAAATPADFSLAAEARFGRGEALLALSANGDARLQTEAAAAFRALHGHAVLGPAARLREAEIALDGHRLKDAARVLLDPLPGGRPESQPSHPLAKEYAYLVGRLRLGQRQPALAQRIFQGALDSPAGLSDRLLVDLYWGQARAFLDEDQPDRAQSELEKLLDNQKYLYPRQRYLPAIFAWLETLYGRLPNPDLTDLQHWSTDGNEREREALARLTLAHLEARAGRSERAETLLTEFGADFPNHPLCARALLDLVALRLGQGEITGARVTLAQARQVAGNDRRWRTGIETLDAQLDLAENDYPHAAERFAVLSERLGTGVDAERAAFNAALAALRSGDAGRFQAARTEFARRFPRSPLAAEFALEEALTRAEDADPSDSSARQTAGERLRRFLAEHPSHPRVTEARLVLAELAFLGSGPDLGTTRAELAAPELRPVANDEPGEASSAARDRAEYLAIWLADAPSPQRDSEQAVLLARRFLDAHPDSPLIPEVRMKLGEIYFAREDYADAQLQLELLAAKNPGSPLADAALYLAGRAASKSKSDAGTNKAVDLFNQTARRPGPFRLPARLRLAEMMLNKADPSGPQDALVLYDEVLAATSGPAPLPEPDLDHRCAALSGRGQALLALAVKEPARYAKAVDAFDLLATGTPGASLRWRRQALARKGHALEETGDTEGALAAYDDALNASPAPGDQGEGSTPEWTWFYRAGRSAASLLESQSQWAAAIAIYKKLAAADGPMKNEFETLLARRRLEHFIWED